MFDPILSVLMSLSVEICVCDDVVRYIVECVREAVVR